MAAEEKQRSTLKVKSNYLSTIISITLVLFMLGLLGMIVLNAHKISEHVRENIGFSLYLQEDLSNED
jgi:cell division transport system permease protein